MRNHKVTGSKVKVYDHTVRMAASRGGVSTETVRRWARAGAIDCRRNDLGNWMFAGEDIDAHKMRHIVTEVVDA